MILTALAVTGAVAIIGGGGYLTYKGVGKVKQKYNQHKAGQKEGGYSSTTGYEEGNSRTM